MGGGANVRSTQRDFNVEHSPNPAQMMNASMRIPANMRESMRVTSTVRVIKDPYSRTSVVEKVIREPVPVPVYQPPPPPKIIHQVEPIYIPQPAEVLIFQYAICHETKYLSRDVTTF